MMLQHLLTNHLLAEEQGGFLPNCGIHDTFGKFLGDIYFNLNSGNSTIAIFFDLKKGFDTIDHSKLLKKLDLLGFHGNTYIYKLLEHYLLDNFKSLG